MRIRMYGTCGVVYMFGICAQSHSPICMHGMHGRHGMHGMIWYGTYGMYSQGHNVEPAADGLGRKELVC